MKKVILFSVLIISFSVFSQPTYEWGAGSNGSSNFDYGSSTIVDINGSVYLAGQFQGTVDFDPGPGTQMYASAGGSDIFIQKLDPLGNLSWFATIGSTGTDYGQSLFIDGNGDIIVTGQFTGTVDFDPGLGVSNLSAVSTDGFVLKLDSNGSFVWVKQLTGTGSIGPKMITGDLSNNLYLCGFFTSTADFDPGPGASNHTSAGALDVFVVKLDSNGDYIWSKTEGSTGNDNAKGIVVNSLNEVFLCGDFNGTVDFDPNAGVANLISNGGADVFIQKLDNNGNLVWAKSVGGTSSENANDVVFDSNGSVYTTGIYAGTVDFDPGLGVTNLTSSGFSSGFILKLDALGNFVWVKHNDGASAGVSSYQLDIDQFNDIYITGSFDSDVDFDPGAGVTLLSSPGGTSGFVQKLSESGNLIWAFELEPSTPSVTEGISVDVNLKGIISVTGGYQNTTDFDPSPAVNSLTALAGTDIFAVKYSQCEFEVNFNSPSLNDLTDECSVSAPVSPTASNCLATYTGVPDVTFPITTQGTTVVTWTYINSLGLMDSQTQNVVINDVTAPVADNAVLTDVNAECSVTSLSSPTATDNCVGSVTGTHNASLPITSQGTTVVTWTYDDGNGNISTQTQNVVINDVTAPVPDAGSLTDINATCSVSSLTAPTATDNCVGSVTGTHNATLPITSQGTTVVTWTYDDGNGNTTTQTQNVIISDVTAPVADNGSLTPVTAECQVTSIVAPTATDNCAGTVTGTPNVSFPITSQGTFTITWTYDDGNGNTSTQTQSVTVDDVTAPVADNAILSDEIAECEVTSLPAPTATDNCAGSLTGTPNVSFPITTQGTTIVTWTYDDGNGNTSTQTQNVIITDVTAPAPDLANLSDINSECEVTPTAPTATDNCAGLLTGMPDVSFPITTTGTTTVTWTYDDGNGNTSSQTQNVIITQIDVNTTTTLNGNNYDITADASGYTYQWIEDCGNTNAVINGATNQTYTPMVNGSYAVIIDNGTCSDTSDCIIIDDLGIEDAQLSNIVLSPNPTNGHYSIDLGEVYAEVSFTLLDNKGRVLKKQTLKMVQTIEEELTYEPGLYFVQLTLNDEHTTMLRIIKQ